ncbi:GIY-YIG nuclease family protein [Leptothermofonsia sichuanensis]|uniref:GIY-YIG nuclease family protein n=1 Tax=Leptothermofonsia sichuanensis TaxID=2917832 RepID=UPI001CEDCCD7|nr:GIY-YIG nuclease family protein [Leptothermofonsia sichuanensis]
MAISGEQTGGEQTSLFSTAELRGCYTIHKPSELPISQDALQSWKQRVFQYQRHVAGRETARQKSLFDLAPTVGEMVDLIHPFDLPPQNIEFWRWQEGGEGVSALYFVIDYVLPILLYVGETVKSNMRWKGEHDCKRYILNYVAAHRPHGLPVSVNIGFWAQAPVKTRDRQQLESALIDKWRSPFNKENWEFWGTPFVGGK